MLLFMFLLPALAHARLNVNVAVSSSARDVNVNLLGADDHVIDSDEASEFRVTDAPLKEACRKYHGEYPTDVYLHSPTPWGDLYQKYGWDQVHRVLKPIKANILSIRSEPSIIATQSFTNNITKTAQYQAELKQEVTNTAENSWSLSHAINVGQEISYEFEIPVGKLGGKTTFGYTHEWGKGGSESKSITVGATASVTVPVEPGDTVEAYMTASRGTMEIEVVYEASLKGNVAANYEAGYKGHFFWKYDINAVMSAGGLPRTLQVSEVIKVGFYSDVEIVVNEKSGKKRALNAKISF